MSVTVTVTVLKAYIDGQWVLPRSGKQRLDVINPATEQSVASLAVCEADDVDLAVAAARRAFEVYAS
jgi:aldehyde dehydrogenase (NAD+)